MRKTLMIATVLAATGSKVQAQTDLTAYADANGYIDVQALTCAALAGTWQGDADRLTTWYSGWYNGLAKKHYFNIARSKELEHEVIVYCKANPQVRIIEAIGVMLKQERLMSGFKSTLICRLTNTRDPRWAQWTSRLGLRRASAISSDVAEFA